MNLQMKGDDLQGTTTTGEFLSSSHIALGTIKNETKVLGEKFSLSQHLPQMIGRLTAEKEGSLYPVASQGCEEEVPTCNGYKIVLSAGG